MAPRSHEASGDGTGSHDVPPAPDQRHSSSSIFGLGLGVFERKRSGDTERDEVDSNFEANDEVKRMPSDELAKKIEEYRKNETVLPSGPSPKSGETGAKGRTLLVNRVVDEPGNEGADQKHRKKKKGAFSGVFVPTCENMWGVLIFLRFYSIVGEAGVLQALAAVLLSFTCAFCTTSSMSATVSSGGVVSQGGPYYMISRALGPCVGASVGVMYWLAITMLSVLETLGAVEGLLMISSDLEFTMCKQVYGSVLMILLAMFVYGGINLVTKLGIFFVAVVGSTLFMFYFGLILAPSTPMAPDSVAHNPYVTGLSWDTLQTNLYEHYTSTASFGYVLSVFFPCFTGILSGANRADILKDPPKNLRQGTFGAIIFSLFMYSSYMILWGAVADYRYLQGTHYPPDYDHGRRLAGAAGGTYIIEEIVWNPFPHAAKVGIIISSLSQALQCLVVAPRLLNAIAKDKILSSFNRFAPLSKSGEPKRALGGTYVVAALLVLIGKLDIVAPLLSMCFLVAYAFMNFSCFALTWLKSPAWRPKGIQRKRWRLWYLGTSFGGFVVCLTIMFTIDPWWALIALFLACALYVFINWKHEERGWGSATDGIRYQLALSSLIKLEDSVKHNVNWRPQVLILYKIRLAEELKGIKHHEILRFYSQLRKGNGFCVVACVLEGELRDEHAIHKASLEKQVIKSIMKEENIQGFAEVVVSPSWVEGTSYIIQLTGIGGITPNTVLLDWPENWRKNEKKAIDFVNVLRTALNQHKAVLAVRGLQEMPSEAVYGTIDIWWMIHDGGFLILLSWLLVQHRLWRQCQLRIFTVAESVSEEQAKAAAEMLSKTLRARRLADVEVEVILADDEMIEPYTYDWTLRVEERHKFLQTLHPTIGGGGEAPRKEALPLEIDDLFQMEADHREGVRFDENMDMEAPSPHANAVQVTNMRSKSGPLPTEYQNSAEMRGKRKIFKQDKPIEFEDGSAAPSPKPPSTTTAGASSSSSSSMPTPRMVVGRETSPPGSPNSRPAHAPSVASNIDHLPALPEGKPLDAPTSKIVSLDDFTADSYRGSHHQSAATSASSGAIPGTTPMGAAPPNHDPLRSGPIPCPSSTNLPTPQHGNAEAFQKLNTLIYGRSKRAQLVVMNLPDLWGTSPDEVHKFMSYCDTLTKGLERVLFVHSSGHEIFDLHA